MTQETENLVLELLRRMREENREELMDLKLRVSALEQAVAQGLGGVQAAIGQIQVSMSSFHRRSDRVEMRAESLESRIERIEGHSAAADQRLARIEEKLKLSDA
jgi:chromosome segregation ATPase